jgi:hypothetical protein
MKRCAILIAAASAVLATAGFAAADDHLFQAEQSGLSAGSQGATHTHAYSTNSAGHSGDLAPGQGSPFSGHDAQTPATDTEAANDHASIKPR